MKTVQEMEISNKSESNTLNIISFEKERFENIKALKILMNHGILNSVSDPHIESVSFCNAKFSDSFHWNLKNLKKLQLVNLDFGESLKNIFNELRLLEELEISYGYSDECNICERISLKNNPLVNCKNLRKIHIEVRTINDLDENSLKAIKVDIDQFVESVKFAIKTGYRHIDTVNISK